MSENRSPIPSRLYNAAKGGHVAGTADIIDDDKDKTQDVINKEMDSALENRYTKEETYSKTELNSLITTPSQKYVSVTATSQTTSATDVLPTTGVADTIYRVGNWDGTQYNDSVLSEYAWNGSAYIKLSTKSQIGEVYDISANHADTKYADLAAALGTNGANIPQSLRKGGMSVKYVQTYDNKYVQYRFLLSSSFTNDQFCNIDNWQGNEIDITNGRKDIFAIRDYLKNSILKLFSYLKIDRSGNIETKLLKTNNTKIRNLYIEDEEHNTLLKILSGFGVDLDGNIITKKFKSRLVNVLSQIEVDENGVIKTSSFDSSKKSALSGKKAVWLGTSIPATGYPTILGTNLGMTVYNESRGSSMCRMGRTTVGNAFGDDIGCSGVSWQNIVLSLSLSQEEKLRIFKRWTTENRRALMISEDGYTAEQVQNVVGYGEIMNGTFAGEDTEPTAALPTRKPIDFMDDVYIDSRKFCYSTSWNNSTDIEEDFGQINGLVEKHLNQSSFPDYWILDHGHNDGLPVDNDTLKTIPTDKFDRRYFIGAMNFIIDKILQYNPHANIVIIGHYSNQVGATNHAPDVCEAQEILANYWQFQFIKAWELLPFSQAVITTTGYWDSNHVWHDTGFDGTNHVGMNYSGINQNPRQINGVWVHDLTMKQVWMWDDLHPSTLETKTLYAKALTNEISNRFNY